MSERLTPFPAAEQIVTDDLDLLLGALPPRVSEALSERASRVDLLEVVLDLGRLPEARYPGREVVLSHEEVTEDDLEFVIEHIGDFGADNRAGIERTLHRISCIRNRRGKIVGLTCRIGRAVYGTIRVIEDLVLSDRSILFLGRPGVGKTTMLREVARVLADDANKRVIIVDTSNEIAGDGDIPHPAIGSARRMQVPTPALQHAVMIEAVENHMPEVIVIDEIGTELEAAAARTIAERGVQLVGTAHGNSLENLMLNPTLSDLIGGIQSVTLGDEEARRRGTQKSILERKAPPTFDVVVEIQNWARVAVHGDVAATIDARLRGYEALPEIRQLNDDGEIEFLEPEREEDEAADFGHFERGSRSAGTGRGPAPTLELGLSRPAARRDFGDREPRDSREPRELRADRPVSRVAPPESASGPATKLYAFGISRQRLEQAIQQTGANVQLVPDIREADAAITLRSYYRRKPAAIREAEERAVPIYVLKTNTAFQVEQVLNQFRGKQGIRTDPMTEVFRETEDAVAQVMREGSAVDLNPQNSYIRRLQHQIVGRYNLESKSAGKEPQRRVRILPLGAAPYASGED